MNNIESQDYDSLDVQDPQQIRFDDTVRILEQSENKNPRECFDNFLNILQNYPEKLNKVSGRDLEGLYMFILDRNNKDEVLLNYVTLIKYFEKRVGDLRNAGLKINENDIKVVLEVKRLIEEKYKGDDGMGIDNWQLDKKIFTGDFDDKKLFELGKDLSDERQGQNIKMGDEKIIRDIERYLVSDGIFLDNIKSFVIKFNECNELRLENNRKALKKIDVGAICWQYILNNEDLKNRKYEIIDSFQKVNNGYSWDGMDNFFDEYGRVIFGNQFNNLLLVDEDEFNRIVSQDNSILALWLYKFGKKVESEIKNNVVLSDLVAGDFAKIARKNDVDDSVILSLIRRGTNLENVQKITNCIKSKDAGGLFALLGITKKEEKVFDEKFFNKLHDYLGVTNLDYGHIGGRHYYLTQEKVYLSMGICDNSLKENLLPIIGKENNEDDIRRLQLRLVDVDINPNNIDLDDILSVDGKIGMNTQKGISNYISLFCSTGNDGDLQYTMFEKLGGQVLSLGSKLVKGKKEGKFVRGVGIIPDSEIDVGLFDSQGSLAGLGVKIRVNGDKEKGIYKNGCLEGSGVRIYGNLNKEEGLFKNGHMVEGTRYENKLYKGYEIVKQGKFSENGKTLVVGKITYYSSTGEVTKIEEGTFEKGHLVKGTKSFEKDGKKILESGTFNEDGELQGKDCFREIDGQRQEGFFGNGEIMDENVENAIQYAIELAGDRHNGYSQGLRNRSVQRNGETYTYYDCSSFICTSFHNAGFDVETTGTTSTMADIFTKEKGFQKIRVDKQYSDFRRGDILLRPGSHTEIYLGKHKTIGAHSDYDRRPGDSKGTEISVKSVSDTTLRGYTYILRYVGNGEN